MDRHPQSIVFAAGREGAEYRQASAVSRRFGPSGRRNTVLSRIFRPQSPENARRIRQKVRQLVHIMVIHEICMVVRTLKQKVYAGGDPGQAGASRIPARGDALRQVALVAVWALVGLIVPRASVYGGMYPFGIGVAAAVSGPGALVVYFAAVVGYLLPMGAAFPLRYVAAIAAVGGIRWALEACRGIKAQGLRAGAGLPRDGGDRALPCPRRAGRTSTKALLILAESLIAGGFAYFFAISMHAMQEGNVPTLTAQQQAGLVVTGSVVLMALSAVQFAGISPGRIAAVVLVLLLARCGKEQGRRHRGRGARRGEAMASPITLSSRRPMRSAG